MGVNDEGVEFEYLTLPVKILGEKEVEKVESNENGSDSNQNETLDEEQSKEDSSTDRSETEESDKEQSKEDSSTDESEIKDEKNTNIKDIAQKEKRGLEETGRKVRYEYFEDK